MTDWNSIQEITKDVNVMYKMAYILLGLYTWEWCTSLQLELDVLAGRKKFKWPMLFYFPCRYCPLLYLAAVDRSLILRLHPVRCGAIYVIVLFSGLGSTAFASFNLSLRTLALWENNRYMKIFVFAVFLGHWSLVGALAPYSFNSTWKKGLGCTQGIPNLRGNIIIHVYTLIVDFVFLGLALYKIMGAGTSRISIPLKRQEQTGRVAYVFFSQGISYFTITSILNLVSVIFYIIDLNMAMAVVVAFPTTLIIPLLACRMVRGLIFFNKADEDIRARTSRHFGAQRNRQTSRIWLGASQSTIFQTFSVSATDLWRLIHSPDPSTLIVDVDFLGMFSLPLLFNW
ncbi:hypothetical protein CPB83DRAFT_786609 [Crepidotus variabilis]|uniref:Uncharacterized protein n=1 Tax=Crepidotus variabilis TaxID=179855 RepID=A0A9P6ELI2_9AGAR|nr:hypothetical protein CPB83DRAFT_786609 [Crepidotus variabilis]